MNATQAPMRFSLGHIVTTPGALDHLDAAHVSPGDLLMRHARGDWGDLCAEDRRENALSLVRGFRLLSSYPVGDEKVWIITEADRSSTTILLAREY